MPKIFSEKGLVGSFDKVEVLSTGDIFLYGLNKDNTLPYTPPKELDKVPVKEEKSLPPTPAYQPSKPVVRIARPPEKKVRLGIMCPDCHQSRALLYGPEYNVLLALNEEEYFVNIPRDKWWITPSVMVEDNELDKDDFISIIKLPDEDILKTLNDMIPTKEHIKDMINWFPAEDNCVCPVCAKIRKIQDWINEYANPTTPFFHTCKICGGEMSIDAPIETFNGQSGKQILQCEQCKYQTDYDVSKK